MNNIKKVCIIYNKCNQLLGGWRVPLLGILGGFESLQKQLFHIFGANEKIGKKFEILGKIAFFREKNRVSSEKLAIFLRIFYFRFFLPKIVSNPTENDFWPKNRPKKNDFFCPCV